MGNKTIKVYEQFIGISKIFALNIAFLSLLRLIFLAWNWSQFRDHPTAELLVSFIYGLRFDISAMIMLMSPWLLLSLAPIERLAPILVSKPSMVLWLLISLPFWLLNLIDIEFVNFVGRRFTASSLYIFREFKGGGTQSFFMPYWPWVLALISLLGIFYYAQIKIWKNELQIEHKKFHWVFNLIIFVILIIGVRGGLQKKPLNFVHANIFVAPIQKDRKSVV